MTDTYSDTRVVSILDRRRQLKRQRRSHFWKGIWRTSALIGCTLGLGWLFGKPSWQLKTADQVTLSGNLQIATTTLESILPLSFPSSLLRIKPHFLKTTLEQNAHIETVAIRRQLFPPKLIIQVTERPPVALTTCPRCVLVLQDAAPNPITLGPSDLWLLDSRGVPLPYASYPKLRQTSKAPDLVVHGYLKPLEAKRAKTIALEKKDGQVTLVSLDSATQKTWQTFLETLRTSPVKVQEIDWQNPNNVSLKTEMGQVRIGTLSPKISVQLKTLDQMRALPQTVDPKKMKFINLENPNNPSIEMNQPLPVPKS